MHAVAIFGTDLVSEEAARDIDGMGSILFRLKDWPIGHFYTTVAGVTRKNANNTSRQKILERLSLGESLDLWFEPDNRHDPFACAVKRLNGEQLGYLDAGIAPTISLMQKYGGRFTVNVVSVGRAMDDTPLGAWISVIYYYGPDAEREVGRYFETVIRPDAESEDPLACFRGDY